MQNRFAPPCILTMLPFSLFVIVQSRHVMQESHLMLTVCCVELRVGDKLCSNIPKTSRSREGGAENIFTNATHSGLHPKEKE